MLARPRETPRGSRRYLKRRSKWRQQYQRPTVAITKDGPETPPVCQSILSSTIVGSGAAGVVAGLGETRLPVEPTSLHSKACVLGVNGSRSASNFPVVRCCQQATASRSSSSGCMKSSGDAVTCTADSNFGGDSRRVRNGGKKKP